MAQREENPLGDLDLDPDVIQNSPVLQDWLRELPDIADEIRNQPSFRTRFRVGYAQFPSNSQATGLYLGVEDVFVIAGSGLTAAASFSRSWNDQRESFGAEVRYYLLPLGSYVNIAPTLGYRSLETPNYTTNGVDVGFRLMIIPSRGGGADIAVGQRWVAPGNSDGSGHNQHCRRVCGNAQAQAQHGFRVSKFSLGSGKSIGPAAGVVDVGSRE
jgi:hypothetical protein